MYDVRKNLVVVIEKCAYSALYSSNTLCCCYSSRWEWSRRKDRRANALRSLPLCCSARCAQPGNDPTPREPRGQRRHITAHTQHRRFQARLDL